jgi:hypothetical protein
MANNNNFDVLAKLLLAQHGMNENGCILTRYENIPNLTLLASSTNGTSGIGKWGKIKVYWSLDEGYTWTGTELLKTRTPQFKVELFVR